MTAPLALTIRQAEMMREAANKLPPDQRARFREAVDATLARMQAQPLTVSDATGEQRSFATVTDAMVAYAVNRALREIEEAAA